MLYSFSQYITPYNLDPHTRDSVVAAMNIHYDTILTREQQFTIDVLSQARFIHYAKADGKTPKPLNLVIHDVERCSSIDPAFLDIQQIIGHDGPYGDPIYKTKRQDLIETVNRFLDIMAKTK